MNTNADKEIQFSNIKNTCDAIQRQLNVITKHYECRDGDGNPWQRRVEIDTANGNITRLTNDIRKAVQNLSEAKQ